MFRNVVIGVDHGEGGHDAVALAHQLVSPSSTVTIAHVYTGDPYVYRGVSSEYAAYERRRDLEHMAHARAEVGAAAELRWHRAAFVSTGLEELCEALNADLLVIGAPQRHGLEHLLEHDTAHAVRDRVPAAVAVAPLGYRCAPRALDEVGVGYNGSEASRNALRAARVLASDHGSRLSACEVIDASPRPGEGAVPDEFADVTRRRLARLTGAQAHVAWGWPSEELTLFSRVVDLLVIGSARRTRLGRPRRNAVARELVRTTRCPLVIVRGAAGAARNVAEVQWPVPRASAGP